MRSTKAELQALLPQAALISYICIMWLQWLLDAGDGHAHGVTAAVEHWVRDGSLAVVPVGLALLVVRRWSRRLTSTSTGRSILRDAAATTLALGAASPLHDVISPGAGPTGGVIGVALHALVVVIQVAPMSLAATALWYLLRPVANHRRRAATATSATTRLSHNV